MIVSENEQIQNQNIPSDQPKEDQNIVKKVNELLSRSKKYRKRYDQEWHYNYKFVCSGRQWPMERPRWRFSEVVNITWADIMTEIAIQTDGRPKFEFMAQDYSDETFVDILRDINDRNWEKYKWSSVVSDQLFDCKLYHVSHAEVFWNPDREQGLGDVDLRTLDPFYCFWDPRASDVNKGRPCRYFIYAEPVPTSQLKLDNPDKADKIKSDVNSFSSIKDQGLTTGNQIYTSFDPYSPTRLPSSAANTQGDVYGGEPQTVLIRCWLRDDTMEEICEEKTGESQADKQAEYILKKKYPNGRYIEIANNEVLLDDVPGVKINGKWVPYDDDAFPIVRFVNYQYPREYAGENEVTHAKGPQNIVNYVWSYILDMFKMQANPITLIGDGAGVDSDEFTNEPGLNVQATDINQIRREPGTPITPGSFDLLTQGINMRDRIQGLQDVSRGAQASNVTSGVMLEGYVEAAQTRPRMKNRTLDMALTDAGEIMVKRIMQFYDKPRVWRITNKEGYPEYIEFYMPTIEETDDNGKIVQKKIAEIKRISTMPDGTQNIQTSQLNVKGIPDVRVTSGSSLPYAKAQKAQTALTYFNAGAIDDQELLKAVDWPNYQEVLRRMAKLKMEAQQAETNKKAG
jgi:hypothetical protein